MIFVPYVCCGDPNMDFTYELVKTLAPYSEAIELGIPFSDPIADGKTIQLASFRALKNRVSVEKIFSMVEKLRCEGINKPLLFMTYYNVVYAYGREKFLKKMNEVGLQGIIIPDLPFGEDIKFEKLAKKYGIPIINLIAPNTKEARAKKILNNSNPHSNLFTYLVSIAGTTGARKGANSESLAFVRTIRKLADKNKKLCVGFGISNVKQAKQFVCAGADGIIVGSEIINIYSKYIQNNHVDKQALKEIKKFARGFKGDKNGSKY